MWQLRRTRADNISAVVAFLDDDFPFNPSSDTSDTDYQLADTDVVDDDDEEEDDTPTDGKLQRTDSRPALVRQIAFRHFSPDQGQLYVKTVTKTKFSPVATPVESSSGQSSSQQAVSADDSKFPSLDFKKACSSSAGTEGDESMDQMSTAIKRKSDEELSAVSSKKPRHPPIVSLLSDSEDSERSSQLITKLSPESLKELRFDEDLGFADDEADDPCLNDSKSESTLEGLRSPVVCK